MAHAGLSGEKVPRDITAGKGVVPVTAHQQYCPLEGFWQIKVNGVNSKI